MVADVTFVRGIPPARCLWKVFVFIARRWDLKIWVLLREKSCLMGFKTPFEDSIIFLSWLQEVCRDVESGLLKDFVDVWKQTLNFPCG